jgi:hypothetical protein
MTRAIILRSITLAALAVAGGAVLMGCAYPQSSIEQGVQLGHLRFVGPAGSDVRVDGQGRGTVPVQDGLVIDVAPGRHVVEQAAGGRVILHREYEVGAGSTINIRGGI